MGTGMCSALGGMEDVPRVATVPPSRITTEFVFLDVCCLRQRGGQGFEEEQDEANADGGLRRRITFSRQHEVWLRSDMQVFRHQRRQRGRRLGMG